jgi:biotin synthase
MAEPKIGDSRSGDRALSETLDFYSNSGTEALTARARELCLERHGRKVFLRGLIEYTNICSCDCLYCGIRRSNAKVSRYRLEPDEIAGLARRGYAAGLRSFVLQGGEDGRFSEGGLSLAVELIRKACPEAAITLSAGILTRGSYARLRSAGADRYLLRFETSDPELHRRLRGGVALERRLEALNDLAALGYQVGSGYMVGLPGETEETRIANALLCRELGLDMVGIGPFIPHGDTPMAGSPQGPIELTLRAAALARLLLPDAHIPATTAAGSLDPQGREKMILAGANVLMPNITPPAAKRNYLLYPGKICLDEEGETCIGCLSLRMKSIGRELSFERGDALRLAGREGFEGQTSEDLVRQGQTSALASKEGAHA